MSNPLPFLSAGIGLVANIGARIGESHPGAEDVAADSTQTGSASRFGSALSLLLGMTPDDKLKIEKLLAKDQPASEITNDSPMPSATWPPAGLAALFVPPTAEQMQATLPATPVASTPVAANAGLPAVASGLQPAAIASNPKLSLLGSARNLTGSVLSPALTRLASSDLSALSNEAAADPAALALSTALPATPAPHGFANTLTATLGNSAASIDNALTAGLQAASAKPLALDSLSLLDNQTVGMNDRDNGLGVLTNDLSNGALFSPLLLRNNPAPTVNWPTALAAPVDPSAASFADDVGARVGWLADQKIGHAEIRLNPEGLGRIDIQLKLDGDNVRADFSAASAEVRQALESQIHRLRDMLSQSGFSLTHAGVNDSNQHANNQTASDAQSHANGQFNSRGQSADGDNSADNALLNQPVLIKARGLLDEYA